MSLVNKTSLHKLQIFKTPKPQTKTFLAARAQFFTFVDHFCLSSFCGLDLPQAPPWPHLNPGFAGVEQISNAGLMLSGLSQEVCFPKPGKICSFLSL